MPALADTLGPAAGLAELSHWDVEMNFTHAPNDVVLGRYTIQRGVGLGGFGEVYYAHSQAGKRVALKRIQRHLDVELRGVSHCLNLKHPNLVSLHDICRDDHNQSWVVMEFVDGPNLRDVLDAATPGNKLDLAEAIRWWTGVAAGVAHLHDAGLVHRDLKPGNLFDDDGIIKVGDYGLSKFISVTHRSGHTESVGTFHYMAPEIGRGNYGREIDIYAMGVILFEMLTGKLPFDGETPQEIIVRHMTDLPDLSDVQRAFREVIRRCLEKDPQRRPQTIDGMLALANLSRPGSDVTHAAIPIADVVDDVAANASATIEPRLNPQRDASVPQGSASVLSQPAMSDEPIARAIRHSFLDLRNWWRTLERSPGSKFFIVLATIAVLALNTHWLLPLASVVGIFYVPYYVIRHMVLQVTDSDRGRGLDYPQANLAATSSIDHQRSKTKSKPKPLSPMEVQAKLRTGLSQRTRVARGAEWATSGMMAVLVGAVLLVITSVVGLRSTDLSATSLAPYGWMTAVVWISTMGLLTLGKVWEGSDAEGISRRLAAATLGAGVGLAAYGLSDFLMLPMDVGLSRDVDATALPVSFYHGTGVPKAAAMMAHFALLFGLLRVWKPVDPLRRVRLSLWSVAVAVVGEWIV
ncbi:MAG: serine/threonine-protein kinase, partial [Planctomycetota bacterium]